MTDKNLTFFQVSLQLVNSDLSHYNLSTVMLNSFLGVTLT